MAKYQAYSEYKDSGVEWLEKLPTHWSTSKLRYMFSFDKGLTITKANLLDKGIPCVNYGEVHSKYGFEIDPEYHPLKCVSKEYLKSSPNALLLQGDFIFADTSEDIEGSGNFTQLTSDQVVFAGYHTIIARPKDKKCSRFYAYLCDSQEFRTQIRHTVKGVKVFSVTQAILRGINIWLPTLKERKTIANFLDHETAKIDTLIEKQQQLIKLLKEKRQAVISHAVTKGLDPNVPMRDSGVEWLGEVPEHWRLGYSKHLFHERKIKALETDEMLTASQKYGVIYQKEFMQLENHKVVQVYIGHNILKHVQPDDFVISMRSFQGGIEYCPYEGAISSAYVPLYSVKKICVNYFKYLFKSKQYIQALQSTTNLVRDGQALRYSNFTQICLPTPPMNEQKEIANFLNKETIKVNKLTEKSEKAITLMQERRTALISAAVTGKIDVRN